MSTLERRFIRMSSKVSAETSKETPKLQKRPTKETLKETYKRDVLERRFIRMSINYLRRRISMSKEMHKLQKRPTKETWKETYKGDVYTTHIDIHIQSAKYIAIFVYPRISYCSFVCITFRLHKRNVERDPQTAKETYERDLKGHIQTKCLHSSDDSYE